MMMISNILHVISLSMPIVAITFIPEVDPLSVVHNREIQSMDSPITNHCDCYIDQQH